MSGTRYAVLLTACVAPNPGVREGLVRSDPATRLADYKRGLEFWLTLDDPRVGPVVFVENSGYPLEELREFAESVHLRRREVEFIGTEMPAPPEGLSYGYSEFELIAYAHAHSAALAGTSHFIKATGRYTFPYVSRLLRRLPVEFRIAADCRGARPAGIRPVPTLLTTALLILEREFYLRDLACLHKSMVPAPPWTRKQFIECVLYDYLYPRRNEEGIILRWPCNCDPVGVAANGDLLDSPLKRIRYMIRAFLRWLWPSLWF